MIIDMTEYKEKKIPYTVAELFCFSCFSRWIDAFPSAVWLKDLECPHCGKVGMVINTGQEMEAGQ